MLNSKYCDISYLYLDIWICFEHEVNLGQDVWEMDMLLKTWIPNNQVKLKTLKTHSNLISNLKGKLMLEFRRAFSTLMLNGWYCISYRLYVAI